MREDREKEWHSKRGERENERNQRKRGEEEGDRLKSKDVVWFNTK